METNIGLAYAHSSVCFVAVLQYPGCGDTMWFITALHGQDMPHQTPTASQMRIPSSGGILIRI